jgi:hypothetical protein
MHPLSVDDAFYQLLRECDYELFLAAKIKGCPHCGGPLDTANYLRKTRGLSAESEICFSLCCRVEGCRKRRRPRSIRFLGRKVYGAWVVILAVEYCNDLGLKGQIARQTISRWKVFWKEHLSEAGSFMKWARGVLVPGTKVTDLPGSLLGYFGFPKRESWLSILKFFTEPV